MNWAVLRSVGTDKPISCPKYCFCALSYLVRLSLTEGRIQVCRSNDHVPKELAGWNEPNLPVGFRVEDQAGRKLNLNIWQQTWVILYSVLAHHLSALFKIPQSKNAFSQLIIISTIPLRRHIYVRTLICGLIVGNIGCQDFHDVELESEDIHIHDACFV